MSKEDSNGNGVQAVVVPMLTVTFDPRTWKVAVGGNSPSFEFAEAMLHMALIELGRQKNARRVERSLTLAGPELLEHLKGSG